MAYPPYVVLIDHYFSPMLISIAGNHGLSRTRWGDDFFFGKTAVSGRGLKRLTKAGIFLIISGSGSAPVILEVILPVGVKRTGHSDGWIKSIAIN